VTKMLTLSLQDLALRITLSIIIGAIIGYERELHNRPAGLRTHILVSLGATIFTIISFYSSINTEPSRIAASIVTGIGFLGAGAIFRGKDQIIGLTTAANIWVIAALGMATGLGYIEIAITGAIISYALLFLGKEAKEKIHKIDQNKKTKK